MSSKFLLGFYTVALIHHLFSFYVGLCVIDYEKGKTQTIRNLGQFIFRFLTGWNFALQTIYIILALRQEYKKENNNVYDNDEWWKRRGFFFNAIIQPMTLLVSLGFWFIYFYHREAVVPEGLFDIVPYWVNYNVHTHILLLPIIELLCHNLHIPPLKKSLIAYTIFSQIYIIIFFASYFEKGIWMYPIYNNLSWIERISYTQMIFVFGVAHWYFGYTVQQNIQKYKINKGYVTKKIA